ncbi:hypothetical protein BN1723_005748, partial [Verticillium longisporum]
LTRVTDVDVDDGGQKCSEMRQSMAEYRRENVEDAGDEATTSPAANRQVSVQWAAYHVCVVV